MANPLKIISEQGLEAIGRYYSLYEGVVIDNQDESNENRLKIVCVDILGGLTFWARPRNQCGGSGEGFKHLSPRPGDTVYITFIGGDVSNPVWEFSSWPDSKANPLLREPQAFGWASRNKNFSVVDDDTGNQEECFQGSGTHVYGGNNQIQAKGIQQIDGSDGLVLGEGENGGLVIIAKLTEKINQLVKEIESLKAQINTHTHGTTQGPTTPPVVPLNQIITPFNQADYEDNHTIH